MFYNAIPVNLRTLPQSYFSLKYVIYILSIFVYLNYIFYYQSMNRFRVELFPNNLFPLGDTRLQDITPDCYCF